MPFDIVFPENNECDFLLAAKRQGFSEIVFTYDFLKHPDTFAAFAKEIILKLSLFIESNNDKKLPGYKIAFLCPENKIQSVKDHGFLTFFDISKIYADSRTFPSARTYQNKRMEQDKIDKDLRRILSSVSLDGLFGLELLLDKKSLHSRNGGLAEVHAKMLAENNILLLENHSLIFRGAAGSNYFSNVLQNASLSKKYGFSMAFFSFAQIPEKMSSFSDIKSFSNLFGLDGTKIISSTDTAMFN